MVNKMVNQKEEVLLQFRQMCQDADVDMNASGVRKILLFLTDGRCPASTFMAVNTGELLDKATVCRLASTSVMTGRMHNVGMFSGPMETQVAAKQKNEVFGSLKCVAGPRLQGDMQAWQEEFEKTKNPVQHFRKRLAETLGPSLCGIHLFKWNGTPRSSMREIAFAVCHYEPTRKGMRKAVKVALGTVGAVGAVAVVGGGVVYYKRRQDASKSPRSTRGGGGGGGSGREGGVGDGGGENNGSGGDTASPKTPPPFNEKSPKFTTPFPQTLVDGAVALGVRDRGQTDDAQHPVSPQCIDSMKRRIAKLRKGQTLFLKTPFEFECLVLAYHDEILMTVKEYERRWAEHREVCYPNGVGDGCFSRTERLARDENHFHDDEGDFGTVIRGVVASKFDINVNIDNLDQKVVHRIYLKHFLKPIKTWYTRELYTIL